MPIVFVLLVSGVVNVTAFSFVPTVVDKVLNDDKNVQPDKSILKLFEMSFFNGVVTVIVFCLFVRVAFIIFNDLSTYAFKGQSDKSIVILLDTSFINGVDTVIVFCFI